VSAKPRRYPCARCGRRAAAGEMIFSRHTRNRYCRDVDACERRAIRRARQAS